MAAEDASATTKDPLVQSPYQVLIGASIVLLLVLNSIGQSEFSQESYDTLDYRSFFFLTYMSQVFMSLGLPLVMFFEFVYRVLVGLTASCGSCGHHNPVVTHGNVQAESSCDHQSSPPTVTEYLEHVQTQLHSNPAFSYRNYATSAAWCFALNFSSTWAWYMSLDLLPVSVNSPLNRSCLLILVFLGSVRFLGEQITQWKLVSLFFCIAGIVVVSIGNSHDTSDKHYSSSDYVKGLILVVIQALTWAAYEIIFRRTIGHANVYGVALQQSLMGVAVTVACGLLLPLVWLSGIEPRVELTGHNSAAVWNFIWYSAAFATSYFLLYALGMSVTSPVYMSSSGLIGIPTAALADYFFHDERFAAVTIVGFVLVAFGVMAMNKATFDEAKEADNSREHEQGHLLRYGAGEEDSGYYKALDSDKDAETLSHTAKSMAFVVGSSPDTLYESTAPRSGV